MTAVAPGQGEPRPDWARAGLEEAGFASDLGERIDAGVRDGRFANLHAVLIARGGKLVLERYWPGEDEVWGRPRGVVSHGPDELHDIRSVTKSVVGLLYGIARAGGMAPDLAAPLVDQFPEYPDLAADPARRRMTVAHALTMTLGTEWDEGLSYADPRNSEHAMELAADRHRFVLDRPMVAAPGERWTYNGGATAILGRLIAKGSGRSLADFARERLFAPLALENVEWVRGDDGEYVAASGLRMRARDLLKIGQLVLDGGRRDGREVVPADWLDRSFRTHARAIDIDYGYQWWLGPEPADGAPRWVAGFGNGGQRVMVWRRSATAIVILAGNYNRPDAWKLPVAIVTDVILPATRPR
ncbi:MAG: serine hydrolase domain-containing protein [Alphaproteobacteria bacterium]